MNPLHDYKNQATRRTFLGTTAGALGTTALSTLLARAAIATAASAPSSVGGLPLLPHFTPKAKRVLCLFQSEGFSHVDLFDNKPTLAQNHGQEIPPSVKGNQRLTGMTSGQAKYPVVAPMWSGRPCGQHGTWITDAMRQAYIELHRLGHAHSIEVWNGDELIGGLYGVAIGQMFFAESMFSAQSGGSKATLAALGAILHGWGWPLFDAQVESAHVVRMGASALPRREFLSHVAEWTMRPDPPGAWTARIGSIPLRSLLGRSPAPD